MATHYHYLDRLLVLPGGEIADQAPVKFLIHDGQLDVQYEQIPLHIHHFLKVLATALISAYPR